MWNLVETLYQDFVGTGMIVALYLVAIIFLFFVEKKQELRILFLYVPLTMLAIFFFPLTAQFFARVAGDEIYYRFLWLLPISLTVAYAGVRVIKMLKGRQKMLAGIGMAIIIMLCGDFAYDNTFFFRAENPYHMPQEVVDICDEIHVEGREVMAVFPPELVQYVRQYDATVCMPYGRESLVENWFQENPLYEIMRAEKIEPATLAAWAKEYQCHYIIIPIEKDTLGALEEYEYELQAEVGNYRIYRDTTLYLGL